MNKILITILALFLTISTAHAGSTYFRGSGGTSLGEFDANAFGIDPEFDTDRGYTVQGALGFKALKGNSFFGEIEAGYTETDASTRVAPFGPAPLFDIETTIDLTTVFFNLGYEHEVMDRLFVNGFAGAGFAHSELHIDVGAPVTPTLRLDNIEGDTDFAWQVGGSAWYTVLAGVQVGAIAKYVDYGDHRTLPGIDYDYQAVDVLGGVRIFWN